MQPYDLIVIGGGPGGYNGAERAAAAGMKVALFEGRTLGGVCLNEGCIPSKALLNSAKLYRQALHAAPFGVTTEGVAIDHAAVLRRKSDVIRTLVAGVKVKMKRHGVEMVFENAVLDGKKGDLFQVCAGQETYAAKRLLVATGSQALIPPIPGIKEGLERGIVLTNREILDLETLPGRLAVIGGGVIGLEMACYFHALGCQVTVVEMLDKIAGPTDAEVSALLQKSCAAAGIDIRLGCRVTGLDGGCITYRRAGMTETLQADQVLLSIGRRPVTQGIGLEQAGVYVEKGAVVTDGHLRTNIPGIYAVGDVNGKVMLAHTAYREGEVAVSHMLGQRGEMHYDTVPSVIYTSPEVAGVGETEETAAAKGLEVEIARVSLRYSGRFLAETDGDDGLCKLLVEKGSRRVVGMHLIGSYAGEIIWGCALMIESRWPVERLREVTFPHPTVAEILREALFQLN